MQHSVVCPIECTVTPTQRSEEPPVLPTYVPLVQGFLHRLLCIFPLRHLLERIVR